MTKSIDLWQADLVSAIAGLVEKGPANLLKRVNVDREGDDTVTPDEFICFLDDDNQQSNIALLRLSLALSNWDFESAPTWDTGDSGASESRTQERRQRIYELLHIPIKAGERLDEIAPVATMRNAVIKSAVDAMVHRGTTPKIGPVLAPLP